MNDLIAADSAEYQDEPLFEKEEKPEWVMKRIKPVHQQICAYVAQGLRNVDIAKLVGVTPQYVTMLLRQPLIRSEIARLNEITQARLDLLFVKAVDVIADTMENGSESGKLKAVRLQLEATHKIGRVDPMALGANVPDDRLEKLAQRLEGLLDKTKSGLYDETGNPLFEEAEIIRTKSHD